MKTPDETKRALVTCTELVMPKEVQHQAMLDALACIQQLEAANAELLTKIEQLEEKCHQLERERDAAVADIFKGCAVCKHSFLNNPDIDLCPYVEECGATQKREKWEWRGVKEE